MKLATREASELVRLPRRGRARLVPRPGREIIEKVARRVDQKSRYGCGCVVVHVEVYVEVGALRFAD